MRTLDYFIKFNSKIKKKIYDSVRSKVFRHIINVLFLHYTIRVILKKVKTQLIT